ncbi:HU family DNA-binding protein [Salinibacter altiplanensis]|uniref:HU family DNA-binding protein n=1 Tax=Salinibacter altiplanensis TaxID=1803181 RepID=UPI000C9F6E72|nr:HU family DNA-binding protein [Salinibacter altiplanensis]
MADQVDTATKEDVARRVADMQGCPLYEAKEQVRSVLTALGDLLIEADPERRIELRNFGVFEVKKTKAKPTARNPTTNEPMFVPSRRKTLFRPGKRVEEVLKMPLRELGYEVPEGSAERGDGEADDDG